jgi:5-methylcytosine-specific restriction endonuclease McrA
MKELYFKQKGRCWYCGERCRRMAERHPKRQTLDHQVPKSRYPGLVNNLVVACQECNEEKGSMTVKEYRRYKNGEENCFYGERLEACAARGV